MSAEQPSPINLYRPLVEANPSFLADGIANAISNDAIPASELTQLLEDESSQRIVLYIPKAWMPTDSSSQYGQAYSEAWWSTLSQPDQRADFTNGDIGELHANTPRSLVVKAAHLTPWLVDTGLVPLAHAKNIHAATDSEVLRSSIEDTRLFASIASGSEQAATQTAEGKYPSLAREAWLRSSSNDAAIRAASLELTPTSMSELFESSSSFEKMVALKGIVRLSKLGALNARAVQPWIAAQLEDSDPLMREKTVTAFRQLHNNGVLSAEVLDNLNVSIPLLHGETSRNLNALAPQLEAYVEAISHHPILSKVVYPAVAIGGSRLKGYAHESTTPQTSAHSDIDISLFLRPPTDTTAEVDTDLLHSCIVELFGDTEPLIVRLEHTANGLRMSDTANGVDDSWSHLVYNTAWVGESDTVSLLRKDLAAAYEDSAELQNIALRRLEQDALQYRLLHKGYERHYTVQADMRTIPTDTLGSQSTYWDPGYRKLATQLFAERVRLPRVK